MTLTGYGKSPCLIGKFSNNTGVESVANCWVIRWYDIHRIQWSLLICKRFTSYQYSHHIHIIFTYIRTYSHHIHIIFTVRKWSLQCLRRVRGPFWQTSCPVEDAEGLEVVLREKMVGIPWSTIGYILETRIYPMWGFIVEICHSFMLL